MEVIENHDTAYANISIWFTLLRNFPQQVYRKWVHLTGFPFLCNTIFKEKQIFTCHIFSVYFLEAIYHRTAFNSTQNSKGVSNRYQLTFPTDSSSVSGIGISLILSENPYILQSDSFSFAAFKTESSSVFVFHRTQVLSAAALLPAACLNCSFMHLYNS